MKKLKEKKIKKQPNEILIMTLLILGITIILFSSVIIFTRPAINELFNLSGKGKIGDAIGGITSPIINVIGALLIYLSFNAQIKANKIQFDLFKGEIINQKRFNNFQISIDLLKELKSDFKKLKYKEYEGQGALNYYCNAIDNEWEIEGFEKHIQQPIYHDWKFLMAEYDLILNHLDEGEFYPGDKSKIFILVVNYYVTQMEYSVNILKEQLIKFDLDLDVQAIINKFDAKKTIHRL